MTAPRDVQIFLEDGLLTSARAGEHNFIALMQTVLEDAGLTASFHHEDEMRDDQGGLSLVHMKRPLGRRGLTFRRVYHYPFWQIDATERRWAWDVARERFSQRGDTPKEARRFQRFWRKRLYAVEKVSRSTDGPVYVPLQGMITEDRSFQSMSPLAMLETTAQQDPKRNIIVTLHPKEKYTSSDLTALHKIIDAYPKMSLKTGKPGEYLPHCAYVVTQNSSVAFDGFFFNKPAILFAKIDFHHIAQNVRDTGPEQAFQNVLADQPDFAAYVYWFWQDQSINAGRPEAPEKIRARFKRLGWPI